MTVGTECAEFARLAAQNGMTPGELAEFMMNNLIHNKDVDTIIEAVTCGSTVIDYFLEVPSAAEADFLDSAVRNLEVAVNQSDFEIQMENGDQITFKLLSNEITEVDVGEEPDAGISSSGNNKILGLSTGPFVGIIVAVVLILIGAAYLIRKMYGVNRNRKRSGSVHGQSGAQPTDRDTLDDLRESDIAQYKAERGSLLKRDLERGPDSSQKEEKDDVVKVSN